jgi:hypothetical protein
MQSIEWMIARKITLKITAMATLQEMKKLLSDSLKLSHDFDLTVRNANEITISYAGASGGTSAKIRNFFGLARVQGVDYDNELDETFYYVKLNA